MKELNRTHDEINKHTETLNESEIINIRNEHEKKVAEAAKDSKSHSAEDLLRIREEVDSKTKEKDEVINIINEQEPNEKTASSIHLFPEIKKETARRNLIRVQKQLSGGEKTFSRVIHSRAIETISNAGEKTIARPSGLLYGGFFSFVSVSLFYFITRHYGYDFSYSLALVAVVGGYFIGLLIELLTKLAYRNNKSNDA